MTNLREHNKQSRRNRILDSARLHFLAHGFEDATIDLIAATAEVSAVTVYNYYGTKGGLLLALVSRSDQLLVEKIEAAMANPSETPLDALCCFSATINNHAFSYLNRSIWRYIIATSIIEGHSEFGQGYAKLDQKLIAILSKYVATLEHRVRNVGRAHPSAGEVFYNLHNARFIQFVTDNTISRERLDALVRRDYAFILDEPALAFGAAPERSAP